MDNRITPEPLPFLISVQDAPKLGFSRSAFYRLMHRADVPTVSIGGRLFIHRDRFFEWLNAQAEGSNT